MKYPGMARSGSRLFPTISAASPIPKPTPLCYYRYLFSTTLSRCVIALSLCHITLLSNLLPLFQERFMFYFGRHILVLVCKRKGAPLHLLQFSFCQTLTVFKTTLSSSSLTLLIYSSIALVHSDSSFFFLVTPVVAPPVTFLFVSCSHVME